MRKKKEEVKQIITEKNIPEIISILHDKDLNKVAEVIKSMDTETKDNVIFLLIRVLVKRNQDEELEIKRLGKSMDKFKRDLADISENMNFNVDANNVNNLKADAIINYLQATKQIKVNFDDLNKMWKTIQENAIFSTKKPEEIVEDFVTSLNLKKFDKKDG